jgi:DNA modification methylase
MVTQIESNKPTRIADIVADHPNEQVIIWTQYDEEGDILVRLIPDAIHLTGNTKQSLRLKILDEFRKGQLRILISKPRLLGMGLNLQHCHICIFSWSADSFESYYQAVGRIQRYGQTEQVKVYIPYTKAELPMLENVMRKQKDYLEDSSFQEHLYIESLLDDLKQYAAKNIPAKINTTETILPDVYGESFRLIHGDCISVMAQMPENQFELAVFSPPFADLYSYTDKHQDIGNCNSLDDEFALHFSFFAHQLYRVIKPGCIVAMHIAPLAIFKSIQGFSGIRDFPAECRELFEGAGFIYHGKATIGKNPQAQAIRTKAHALLFKTLRKDSRQSRFAIPDFLMKFQKPGEAPPIRNQETSNEEWIKLASPIWDWVDETNTLNRRTKEMSDGDVRHICPLQLDVIDACIRLWSGPGEHILSPFMGIGSEGVVAVKLNRHFTGIELKEEYFRMAVKNIFDEENQKGKQISMFG